MSGKLLKSTAVTGAMTLVSRITGLVRDVLFARFLGASAGVAADAFYVAFAIPNFFRRIFGEGAFSQAFVPVLAETQKKQGDEAARKFVNHMFGAFGLILFLVTLIGIIASPLIIMGLAPGFMDEPTKFDLTVAMLRITFPYLMFISLVAMAAGILNTRGKFAAAAFTPVFLNLCLIAAVIWLTPLMDQPVVGLAWGVFIAGVVQLGFQVPFLKRAGMLGWPKLARHNEVSKVFKLMVPAIFGSSVAQVNLLVNRILASFLVTGSVSWLYYSDRLMEFPLGVFGIALATVILPSLSRRYADGAAGEFSHLLDWSLRLVFLIAVPAAVGLAVLAGPMIVTLFQYGAFNATDVEMTSRALVAFAIGLPGFILVKVLAPGFYARQDTRTPAKIAMIAFAANIVLSLALVWPLKHVGLALAISLSTFINCGLLFVRLRKEQIYQPDSGWSLFLIRIVLASTAMGTLLYFGAADIQSWLDAGFWVRVVRLAQWIGLGILVYGVALVLSGLKPGKLIHKPH
ncbi:MAG: murein biosynthesis integral membrane protein MurJ [Gammaproteobacteria bacterium]|nr:murein biosynthesis integral membrane protein MurJ [Gammaproteobacteria bacterium]